MKTSGNLTVLHRSNSDVRGERTRSRACHRSFRIGYVERLRWMPEITKDGNGKEVVASRYKGPQQCLNLAGASRRGGVHPGCRLAGHSVSGCFNQSMDMTSNKGISFNAGYNGVFDWGQLEARVFRQRVRHKMDVLEDKAKALGFFVHQRLLHAHMDTGRGPQLSIVATTHPE